MVESIVTVVSEFVKCLAPPTERRLGYLRNYKANVENLKAEIDKLKDERRSIQHRVSEAERKGENIEEKVEKWLVSANNTIEQAAKFIDDEETTNKPCLMGLCPNLKTRYQLSKKAETEVKGLVELKEEAGKFDNSVSYRPILEEIWVKSNKGYEAFESRLSTLEAMQNALTDVNVSIIGVYGMGGIGKTTLVKEFARRAIEDKLYDMVVFLEVSQTPNIKKIQGEIAEKLGLELSEEAESRRASKLYERLKNDKKILVILDNIWKYLDLETVGIPFGDDNRGCKLLLTARDRNVLLSMGSENNFLIGILNEQEAWRLFKIMAGNYVENRELKSTATSVAKACGGLPIALTTVARALRNKELPVWKNALQELQTPSEASFDGGVPVEAYSTIELSYKYLRGEQLKKTFLLCSLITPTSIMDLFKYSVGLGAFESVHKLEDAHNKLDAWVNQLRDSCLLLEDGSSKLFSMHDVVRDVAISIACGDKIAFAVRNEDVWKWPDADALKKYPAIFLKDSIINDIPEVLESPQLEFLLMSPKNSFVAPNVPENFFERTKKLRVLDLTRMQLLPLPSSIDHLVNLRTLCLDQSILGDMDIAIIGKLENLEILSFVWSDIVELPKALGQLTKLRLLDLRDCFRLKVIAPDVISSLIRLEELYMGNCSVEWEVERANSERSNASLDELMLLPWLTTLEIDVKNDSILPEGFLARKLERFKISIGNESFMASLPVAKDWFRSRSNFLINDNHECLRELKLKLDFTDICSMKLQAINNVEYLWLDKLQGVKNVLFDLDTKGFPQLKFLWVQNNPDFFCIVDSMEMVACDAFPLLESLTLHNLINMERICIDRLKMKEIFATEGDADVDNNNATEKIELAQLRSLSLGNLPEVTTFFRNLKTPSASPNRQGLQEELTSSCSNEINLETLLFNGKVGLPNLEALEISEINVDKIWHYNHRPVMLPRFQSLTRLIVCHCNKLKYIFLVSMIQSFEHLQEVEIVNCRGLQEIISEDRVDHVTPRFVFQRVTTLILQELPELKCLYHGMHTSEWPALKILVVSGCDKLKTFAADSSQNNEDDQLGIPAQRPLFLFKKILPNLESLALSGKDVKMILDADFPHLFEVFSTEGCLEKRLRKLAMIKCIELGHLNHLKQLCKQDSKLDSIFQYLEILKVYHCQNLLSLLPSSSVSFRNLTKLVAVGCKELIHLVTSSTAKTLVRLVTVQVYGCRAMTEVVINDKEGVDIEEIVFSKLKALILCDLDSLTSFCSANYTFKFPSLEYLEVIGCPKMKTFTSGESNTPPRVSVSYGESEDQRRWANNDLNTTIQQLHAEKLLAGSSSYFMGYD
ncbi:Disease resistance protein [Citrus sinensis]|uniref:Disease resistance protein n=1 Tax=Citrus sinensis TaxID=2711 RepID=A0ACB8KEC5_CITSI|nr:Disease resistance protein [Citrus sinensis]